MTININRIIEKIKNPAVFVLILIAFLTSLYIRAVLPHDSVFLGNGIVSISEDDGVYQMRIVEWIIHNYPHFLWFDVYTLYPTGISQPWAPFFTFSLATIIWIAGLGSPSQDLIYTIGAYYPAILGALVVFPTYFIAKNAFDDRRIGILSAFIIAVLPGQFLSRSLLGFTDHHVAETLLSTVTMLFLVLSVKAARKHVFTFVDIKNKNWDALKSSISYFALTGIFLSLYVLTWKGALLFAFIIGVYLVVQHIVDHMHNKPTDYLGVLGVVVFLITLIAVILVPQLGGTKDLYYVGLFVGIAVFPVLSGISIFLNNNGYKRYYYPLSLGGLAVAGLVVSRILLPYLYYNLVGSLTFFVRSEGGLTVAEAMPYLYRYEGFSFDPFIRDFGYNSIIAFIALVLLATEALRRESQEKNVFLIWTVMILWALFQQNRFAYYYAVNVAILSAYFGMRVVDSVLEFGGWKDLLNKGRTKVGSSTKKKDKKVLKKGVEAQVVQGFDFKKIKPSHIIFLGLALIILFLLVYPLYDRLSTEPDSLLGRLSPSTTATELGKYGRGMQTYWYESLNWMRYNTPDPGVDYFGIYKEPPPGEKYPYPESAYGVMSWWDYGHVITAWAHRIPNADPFQAGIGGGADKVPGASTYLSAQSEDGANAVLDALGVNGKPGARYVITDDYITFDAFGAVLAWADEPDSEYFMPVSTDKGNVLVPSDKSYNAMMRRLHLFDGNGLKTYRLVHESVPVARSNEELNYKQVYNLLFGGNLSVTRTGYVKIFEHVKGARIKGNAPVNETVSVSLKVKTNQGRDFTYSQKTISNGSYELVVPYSTEGPVPGETQFDTMPVGKYMLSADNVSREVSVDERTVLDGGIVKVDLI